MISRGLAGPAIAFVVGTLAFLVAADHAEYLGFDLTFAFPAMIAGAILLSLIHSSRFPSRLKRVWSTSDKALLMIVLVGALLRVIMMFNPDATEDEWKYFFAASQSNLLSYQSLVQNYNQIPGGLAENPPLALILVRLGYLVSPSLVGARLVITLMNIATIPTVYLLAKELSNERTSKLCTVVYALTPASLYFLDAADSDAVLFFFGIVALALYIRGLSRSSLKLILMSAVLFGLAFWSKGSLPDIWLGAALFLTVSMKWKFSPKKSIGLFVATAVIALAIFLPWAYLDYESFRKAFVSTISQAFIQFISGQISLEGSGTTISQPVAGPSYRTLGEALFALDIAISYLFVVLYSLQGKLASTTRWFITVLLATVGLVFVESAVPGGLGQALSSASGVLQVPNILPLFAAGGGTYTSYVDVLAQIPLWFSPLVPIIGIPFAFYVLAKRGNKMVYLSMILWVGVILFALLTIFRDVRYFIDVATFPIIFLASAAITHGSDKNWRRLELVFLLFVVIFTAIGMTVGYESYSGVSEAAHFVNQNLPNASVMTDYGAFYTLLVHNNVSGLILQPAQLDSYITKYRYDAAVVWSQGRTVYVPPGVYEVLGRHYLYHQIFGLSSFSFVSVYYNKTS